MPSDIGLKDRELLNLIQSAFPLVETPFFRIGESLGLDESDVLERIQRLKDTNIVRQISAIFDTRKLGYKSSLVAMRFEANSLDDSAHVISEHPGVSHNYARDGHYNLWFTLAVPPEDSLEDTVDDMAKATNAEAYRLMPTIRFFKIGVNFDMVKGEGAGDQAVKPMRQGANGQQATPLTDSERHVVRELQEDISIEPAPFEGMAGRLGMSQTDLFAVANDMIDRGVMRRFSAVLHHRRAGFRSNAMVVWKVPKERSEEVGAIMAESKWVSHCYERPTYPEWPYSHFTMVHATTREGCEKIADELRTATGLDDFKMLYSTREYKKTRVRYFV